MNLHERDLSALRDHLLQPVVHQLLHNHPLLHKKQFASGDTNILLSEWFTSGNTTVLHSKPSLFRITDQLVARVVDEVTKRLSSADPIHQPPVASTGSSQGISCPAPGSLTELCLVVPDALPTLAASVRTSVTTSSVINSSGSPSNQLPGLPLVSFPGLADGNIQGSVAAMQSALSDELPVTNPVQAFPLMLVYLTSFIPKYGITNI